jgi:hypothetical protein
MGSSAVVYLLVFGLWKLLREVRSLLRGACSDLEHWYHVDRFSVAPPQLSEAHAGIHTRFYIRRLTRDLQITLKLEPYHSDPDPVASCIYVGPPDAGQYDVATEMAAAVQLPLWSIDVRFARDPESVVRLLRISRRSNLCSTARVIFFEHVEEATLALRQAMRYMLRTGTFPAHTQEPLALHGSTIIFALTLSSDIMEGLYALSERELRDALSDRYNGATTGLHHLLACAHVVLPFCYPSHEAVRAIVAERLPIVLRLLGYARLRVDAGVVEALTSEVEASGYPLPDIDHMLCEYLVQAIREGLPRKPWFARMCQGRFVITQASQMRTSSVGLTQRYVLRSDPFA